VLHKQLPFFISVCILRDRPQQKSPKGFKCQGSSPVLYVPMFLWKCFFSTKWERSEEIRRELFMEGEGRFLQEHPRMSFPPQENALIHEPPLQLFTTYLLTTHLWVVMGR